MNANRFRRFHELYVFLHNQYTTPQYDPKPSMLKPHPIKLPRCRTLHNRRHLRPLSTAATQSSQTEPSPASSNHSAPPALIPEPFSTPLSTLHIGTSYEYLCARTLPLLGFTSLLRTGGRSDRGIDLLAHWTLPSSSGGQSLSSSSSSFDGENTHHLQSQNEVRGQKRGVIKALVQCKAHTRKPGPDMIRELEGAVSASEREGGRERVVGVLCAKREATAGVREAVRRCRRGIVWVMIEDSEKAFERRGGANEEGEGVEGFRGKSKKVDGVHEGRLGRIKQILWNEEVGRMAGGRVGAGVRYIPDAVKGKGAWSKEVVLTVDGRVWVPDALGMGQGQEGVESAEGLLVDVENRFGAE